jgi:signal transduction histidine kinase
MFLENSGGYLDQLERAGVREAESIRRHGTAVLTARLSQAAAATVLSGRAGLEEGTDDRGLRVLRSHSPLHSPKLDWTVVAEISAWEAFAPVRALQLRVLGLGLLIALVFLLAAGWLATSVTRPVVALASGARRLGSGDFGTRVFVETSDEIGQLAASFNRMAEDLEKTTVSKRDLEVLAGKLLTAQEQERSRIARELHDDVTQRIAAIAIEAGRIERMPPEPPEPWRTTVSRIKHQLAQLSDDVHRVSWSLHPATLEDLGLQAAIESECRRFFERGGPPVELIFGNLPDKLPRQITLALFRIVQEALRNIERHAAAEDATIRLEQYGKEVHLEIRDSGHGFDRAALDWRPGLGLASMEERVRLCNGRFRVESRPTAGTTISVTVPLKETDEEAKNSAGR